MDNDFSLDIEEYVGTIDSRQNPAFARHLKDALLWLGKRQTYSHEYYRQLKRNTTPKKLETALYMIDEGIMIRYEASNLAYLQNIHAACDAFPFALHVLLGGLSTTKNGDDEHFKWTPGLIKEVVKKFPHAKPLHAALWAFLEDTNFLMLKALVNQAKHQYFPKLYLTHKTQIGRYVISIPSFEYLTYQTNKPTKVTKPDLDILEFAKVIHNETLRKIFELYKLAYECVK